MKLGDFSTLLQLGIGLHLGTAFFEIVAEFARSPLERKLTRLRELASVRNLPEAAETALDALGDLETKSVQFFNDYRNIIVGNGLVGFLLLLTLIWISVDADASVPVPLAVLLITLSVIPAPFSVTFLWRRWTNHTKRLRERAAALERQLIYSPASGPITGNQ
jgi:hypothetical protein